MRNSTGGVFSMQYPRPAYVAADLAVTPLKEALTAKGFDPSKPALFTCEGILTYLPQVQPSEITRHSSFLSFKVLKLPVLGNAPLHMISTAL